MSALAAPVSVIVVSRGRPALLGRCLQGLSQLFYPSVEVIVVADPDGIRVAEASGLPLKLVPFDEANISKARNLGLAHAAGTFVAFIDDDAVAEPSWLNHLIPPFDDPNVEATGGYVRGRNGISLQWSAQWVDRMGQSHPLDMTGDVPELFRGRKDMGIRTEGTNCAFRRDTLCRMGGFDPAYAFFLDETDVNMRLGARGVSTVLVPLAQVHHGYAENAVRTASRAPTDLTQIGSSSAVFARKHAPDGADEPARVICRDAQRRRLLQHMVEGRLEPGQIATLLGGFDAGWAYGIERELTPPVPIEHAKAPFKSISASTRGARLLSGRIWQAKQLRDKALKLREKGHVVTLILLSPSALPMREAFTEDGIWERSGGIFGRTDRQNRIVQLSSFGKRIANEVKILEKLGRLDQNQEQTP
ncbi:glycosyltransferase family 2 protein [Aliiroseovarius marinus]|uniref:glycosyltransferase family 2 protein n=1 Tax=Aliiroseovarius marinus TaxID=2500159 RepID=UPI003D7E72C3